LDEYNTTVTRHGVTVLLFYRQNNFPPPADLATQWQLCDSSCSKLGTPIVSPSAYPSWKRREAGIPVF
jgi:hypothetical protein